MVECTCVSSRIILIASSLGSLLICHSLAIGRSLLSTLPSGRVKSGVFCKPWTPMVSSFLWLQILYVPYVPGSVICCALVAHWYTLRCRTSQDFYSHFSFPVERSCIRHPVFTKSVFIYQSKYYLRWTVHNLLSTKVLYTLITLPQIHAKLQKSAKKNLKCKTPNPLFHVKAAPSKVNILIR